ncbi:hypothetical protein Ddc_07005 [Ditylenchus destructor]|nr:hypothetical protein Ddc_07005 [Ditylenchus destructor]
MEFICFMTPRITVEATTAARTCPAGTNYFGPCLGGLCPRTCPNCQCFGTSPNDACCTTDPIPNIGANNNLGNLLNGICRDRAINCLFYRTYCTATLYIACMSRHCANTCGFCALRALNGPNANLLNNLGLGGNNLPGLLGGLDNGVGFANVPPGLTIMDDDGPVNNTANNAKIATNLDLVSRLRSLNPVLKRLIVG